MILNQIKAKSNKKRAGCKAPGPLRDIQTSKSTLRFQREKERVFSAAHKKKNSSPLADSGD
jgi:hypothetical protein